MNILEELDRDFKNYTKELNACCNCVQLTALNTLICAGYIEDTADHVDEVVALVSRIDSLRGTIDRGEL